MLHIWGKQETHKSFRLKSCREATTRPRWDNKSELIPNKQTIWICTAFNGFKKGLNSEPLWTR